MGHDIYAYLGPENPAQQVEWLPAELKGREVAYLRRGARNPFRHQLYEVLDAQDCDGDVSGAPGTRWFSREELQTALSRLRERLSAEVSVEDEIAFVEKCLNALPPGRERIYVYFG